MKISILKLTCLFIAFSIPYSIFAEKNIDEMTLSAWKWELELAKKKK